MEFWCIIDEFVIFSALTLTISNILYLSAYNYVLDYCLLYNTVHTYRSCYWSVWFTQSVCHEVSLCIHPVHIRKSTCAHTVHMYVYVHNVLTYLHTYIHVHTYMYVVVLYMCMPVFFICNIMIFFVCTICTVCMYCFNPTHLCLLVGILK